MLIRYALEGGGHTVIEANSEAQCLDLLRTHPVALLLLAEQLLSPDGQSLSWLRREPAARHLPVLLLTERARPARSSIAVGADSALPHDCAPRELVAHVSELLADSSPGAPRILRAGPFEMDCEERLVFVDGKAQELSPCEFRVLELLMRHPNRALSRDEILRAGWTREPLPKPRAVDVYVKRLRTSLGPEFGELIKTVRPMGYRLLVG
jgi:DNA-binding response OmpR family regulator